MKDTPQSNNATKERILEAAKAVFSEKGFDGTRVSEIAEKAEISKSMLYYYFESKEAIFHELVRGQIDYIIEAKQKIYDYKDFKVSNKEAFYNFFTYIIEHMEEKKDVYKIIINEALKNSSKDKYIFEVTEHIIQDTLTYTSGKDIDSIDRNKLKFASFFFGAVPMAMFMALADKWSEVHGFDRQKIQKLFIETFPGYYTDFMLKFCFNEDIKIE